jgi:hypothetical protein
MRPDWNPRGKDDPPPAESEGQLDRVPRTTGAATAMQEVHLRVILESKAAANLRGALERGGKRTAGIASAGRLLEAFCVDVAELELQRYTGTVRVCSCDAFDRA